MTTGSDLLWQLYLAALEQGLRIPADQDFLGAARSVPLALNVATTIDPVPLPQALAEVYRLGDTMPAWKTVYQPSADGRWFGQYEAFAFAIAVPPDGGPQYRSVRQARQLLRQTRDEIAAGGGSLVMAVATDSGTSTVPRYDSGPLGKPGYSEWLEQAILSVANGLPPEVDVTVRPDAAARRHPPVPRLPPFLSAAPALAAVEPEEIVELRLTIQRTTYLPLGPAAWFVASLLRDYTQPQQFTPGTSFARGPIWGPDGLFNLLTTGIYAGFRPEVTVTLAARAFARVAAGARRGSGQGPLRFAPADHAVAAAGTSLQGMLLGVVVDAPNYPSGP